MNDTPQQQTEFVLRRLNDAFQFGGREVSPFLWLAILIPVLVLGLVYVGWQYRRDCRSIAWPWAVLLGGLRATVYLILAGIFLLPAMQTWERSEKHGRVLLLLDVSPSVAAVSDDMPEDGTPTKLATRLDKVIAFLGTSAGRHKLMESTHLLLALPRRSPAPEPPKFPFTPRADFTLSRVSGLSLYFSSTSPLT